MQLKCWNKGPALIAEIKGELDHHSAEDVRTRLDREIAKSTTSSLILDLSGLTFMDSSGIGVIMGRYKKITGIKGKMAAVNLSPPVRKIFDMSGMTGIIRIYPSLDKAIGEMI